ncbi:MBL fold metallo-hydrolase [Kitasatospora sp. NPDC096204]|uniref:MBL fold metallo-hydrolase n=1 Tax=Kitasatospora sp. NPDC096204 TaxID=3364094 RepID=UPI0037F82B40
MIRPTRRTATEADFTRRRLAQLALLGLTDEAPPAAPPAAPPGPASAATPAPPTAPSTARASTKSPPAARAHYDRARRLAADDPVLRALVTALTPGSGPPPPPVPTPEPVKPFDNLVLLSAGRVSATAVLTDDGIVLVDALTSPADAEDVIIPGLRAVGADPAAIRHVVVTHGHADHFGGAQTLADRYGARVHMAPADWDLLTRTRPSDAPVRDLDIADGAQLTLGGTTIELHHTPGHTPGTVSPVIPVLAGRRHHSAMLWGGLTPPSAVAELRTFLASVHSFRAVMRRTNVEVELSNHPNDHDLERVEHLRHQPPGAANPFLLGGPRTQRYMAVMDAMLRGRIADAEAVEAAEAAGAAKAAGRGAGARVAGPGRPARDARTGVGPSVTEARGVSLWGHETG